MCVAYEFQKNWLMVLSFRHSKISAEIPARNYDAEKSAILLTRRYFMQVIAEEDSKISHLIEQLIPGELRTQLPPKESFNPQECMLTNSVRSFDYTYSTTTNSDSLHRKMHQKIERVSYPIR